MMEENSISIASSAVDEASPLPLPDTFEDALAELELIVKRMEGEELSLEERLLTYKRGTELVAHCRQLLAEAQQQIEILDEGALKLFEVRESVS